MDARIVADITKPLQAIAALRKGRVRVHCITNTVAQPFTANVLLACGAQPSMTVSPEEVSHFTRNSDALLVNLGTLDENRRQAVRAAAGVATRLGKPMVLDPVKCDMSPPRQVFARELLGEHQMILKVNKIEATTLTGAKTPVRIITGASDLVTNGWRQIAVHNGAIWMDRTVAMGCALGALVAALVTKAEDPFEAAIAALVWFGVAGEIAADKASGPGSFEPAFLDALANVDEDTLRKRANVT